MKSLGNAKIRRVLLFFFLREFGMTQVLSGKESCPKVGKDCSDQLQTCPADAPGSPLEFRTEKDGAFVVTVIPDKFVRWRNILHEEVTACLKETTPSGMEPGYVRQYLCRTVFHFKWIMGKISFNEKNCDFTCDILIGFKEIKISISNDKSVQILMYTKSTLNWVKYSGDGNLLGSVVYGGRNGEILQICRHVDADGNAFIGTLMLDSRQCTFLKGEEISAATTSIEILKPVSTAKICPPLTDECPNNIKSPVKIVTIGTEIYDHENRRGNIVWTTVSSKNVKACLKAARSGSGEVDKRNVYFCRTLYNSVIVLGKIELERMKCTLTCDIADADGSMVRVEIKDNNETQILLDPDSQTKWVGPVGKIALTDFYVSSPGRFGKTNSKERNAVLCRTYDGKGNIYIGQYTTEGVCWCMIGWQEVPVREEMEVLKTTADYVPNIHGDTDTESWGRSIPIDFRHDFLGTCKQHSAVCPNISSTHAEVGYLSNDVFTKTGYATADIYWITSASLDVFQCLDETTHGGLESGLDLNQEYICRALYEGFWVPGKVSPRKSTCDFLCDIVDGSKHTSITFEDDGKTQILMFPESALSWGRLSSFAHQVENAINGGQSVDGDIALICRVLGGIGITYIGRYDPACQSCLYTIGNKTFVQNKPAYIDILMQTNQAKVCQNQKDTCSSGADSIQTGVYSSGSIQTSEEAEGEVKWRTVEPDDITACLKTTTEILSISGSIPQYLCKVFYESQWVPGKLENKGIPCNTTCDILVGTAVLKIGLQKGYKIQILSYPSGSINWQTLTPSRTSIENFIIGGHNPNKEVIPICRFNDGKGNMHIGLYALGQTTCWYFEGDEIAVSANMKNIEILVTMAKGTNTNGDAHHLTAKSDRLTDNLEKHTVHGYTVSGNTCGEQASVCSVEKKIPVEFGPARENVTGNAAQNIYWISLMRENVIACLQQTTPGVATSPPQFVCRALYHGKWIPGRLNIDSCQFSCVIDVLSWDVITIPLSNDGNIQLLMNQESISYEPFHTEDARLRNIYAGNFYDGSHAYLCRYRDTSGGLYIGKYFREWMECFYQLKGVQVRGKDTSRIEFTVLNVEGSEICPTQQSSCPSGNQYPVEISPRRRKLPKDRIYWKTVSPEDVAACASITNSIDGQYICRTMYNNRWISGRLQIGKFPCKPSCVIAITDKCHRIPVENNQQTQLLISKSGMRWSKVTSDLRSLVYSGVFDDDIDHGDKSYICRYKYHDGKFYIGRYLSYWNECFICPSNLYAEMRGKDKSKMRLLVSS